MLVDAFSFRLCRVWLCFQNSNDLGLVIIVGVATSYPTKRTYLFLAVVVVVIFIFLLLLFFIIDYRCMVWIGNE